MVRKLVGLIPFSRPVYITWLIFVLSGPCIGNPCTLLLKKATFLERLEFLFLFLFIRAFAKLKATLRQALLAKVLKPELLSRIPRDVPFKHRKRSRLQRKQLQSHKSNKGAQRMPQHIAPGDSQYNEKPTHVFVFEGRRPCTYCTSSIPEGTGLEMRRRLSHVNKHSGHVPSLTRLVEQDVCRAVKLMKKQIRPSQLLTFACHFGFPLCDQIPA